MTPQELKNSILQRAIEGKLVDQRPEEGSGEELYKLIQEEKKKLIKEGKIKKQKPLPEITEDKIPFDLPVTWKWVRLGDIFFLEMGQSPKGSAVNSGVKGIEFHQGKSLFGDKFILESDKKTTRPTKIADENSILLCVRAPVGKVNITPRKICIGRGLCSLNPINFNLEWAYYLLVKQEKSFIKQSTGTTFKAISKEIVSNQIIPLPPLAEQKRIVEKIEDLMPLVDEYEKSWQKLEDLNKKFPEDMKKSLLQEAIRGKLVEQRPEERSGENLYKLIQEEKEKLIKEGKIKKQRELPEITEEEIPFDLPVTWKWVRLGDVFQFINGDRGKNYPSKSKLKEKGEIPFISAINLKDDTVDKKDLLYLDLKQYEKLGSGKLLKNDIVLCIRGSLGKCCIYPFEKGAIASSLVILRNYKDINLLFSINYLNSYLFFSETRKYDNGTAQPNLSALNAKKILIPLPPLAEQKRIVEKLDELLPLCDQLIEK